MGMTINDVKDQFDFPMLKKFNEYCEEYPPQHILVAAYLLGDKKSKKVKGKKNNDAQLIELMGMANGGVR